MPENSSETDSFLYIAGALGVEPEIVRRELWRAIRRSEPDANEVYGLVNGVDAREGNSPHLAGC